MTGLKVIWTDKLRQGLLEHYVKQKKVSEKT
jgi:hypothetical protein